MSNSSHKILITGGNGQLALALRHHPQAHLFHVISCARDTLDITDNASIKHAIDKHTPDIIINTAAYTAVDKAEQEEELALRANHVGAQNIAVACKKNQIPLIHISTDYVFDGIKNAPYVEDDATNPLNVYGKSKLLGEQAIREQHDQHIILRVSGVFGEYGNNFMKTMVKLAREKKELRVVADQFTCPTSARDIASAIYTIAKNPAHWGTYHYCSADPVSWHDFAVAVITEAETHYPVLVECIKGITTAEYPTAAKRPAYSVLDCTKIGINFGVYQPSWMVALKNIMGSIIA